MSVVDWTLKPEPWRSIGLAFVADLGRIVKTPVGQAVAQGRAKTIDRDPTLTRGQHIRALREKRKWSRAQLARHAGLSGHTVRNLEEGVGHAQYSTLVALSKVFARDLVAFYGRAEKVQG